MTRNFWLADGGVKTWAYYEDYDNWEDTYGIDADLITYHSGHGGMDGNGVFFADFVRYIDENTVIIAASNRSEGHKIGGCRRIPLDGVPSRTAVGRICRNNKPRPPLAPDLNAKTCHQLQRDQNIGLRDQLTIELDHQLTTLATRQHGRGHQQGG